MRTTIDLSAMALNLARRRARELRRPVGDVVSDAIVFAYDHGHATRTKRWELPVSGSGGLRPGIDLDRSSTLIDLMDGRD